ncbi:MAG: hypothetical protein GYA60_04505 [Candidatus Methanofastidiosa archaeon]|nr:hypothetical protein [Candidatus Methanofastidiosa archaeon]
MARGGKREGSGRKPLGSSLAISRNIRVTQEDWDKLKELASKKHISVTQYILKMSLPNK